MIANGTVITDFSGLELLLHMRWGKDIKLTRYSHEIQLNGQRQLVELHCDFRDGSMVVGISTFNDEEFDDKCSQECYQTLSALFAKLLLDDLQEYPTIYA